MANTHLHSQERPRDSIFTAAAWLICATAAIGAVTSAYAWSALCQDGTFDRCPNGTPSFELVFQFVLATGGFATTVVMWFLVKHRRYHLAGVALAIAVALFGSWAVFLDAATHGWDNLKLLWLG